jgi:hypothetical protein
LTEDDGWDILFDFELGLQELETRYSEFASVCQHIAQAKHSVRKAIMALVLKPPNPTSTEDAR